MAINLEIFNKNKAIKNFYSYEGKLATEPILKFLHKESRGLKGVLIDFGCGNKIYKSLFQEDVRYIGVDLYNETADYVEVIKQTSFHSQYADYILCNQVIEHDCEPDKILVEIYRVMKFKGTLFLSAPQIARLHG